MTPRAVVFDIGGVLVDWQPQLAWLDELGSVEAVEAFMARIDFPALNLRADAGERFSDLAAELPDAEDRRRLKAYVSVYYRTVRTAIESTWTLLDRLRGRGVELHAITNLSAETWSEGLRAHPRLATAFGVTVVSGYEGVAKPDRRIFEILCTRAGLAPEDCLFIDDSPRNVTGAKAAGMDAVRFTGPDALENDLKTRGLL